jgi:hypothetical protein
MVEIDDAIKVGTMRKKGGRMNLWGDRYFVLKGSILYYFVKMADNVRKCSYSLLMHMIETLA